jgi:hypothetical protein
MRTGSRLLIACGVGLIASLAVPLVTGRVFVYNDLSLFHLPLRHLYQESLSARELLLWTPSVLGGFYIHGEGQIGMLHPWHLALYGMLPLQVAFNLEFLGNYLAAGLGMWWLLRRLGFDLAASCWGALLFAFAGFNLLHHHHLNVVGVVAHMPWLLASADLVLGGKTRRERSAGYAGVALTTASALLLGFPQAVWWNVLALGAFVAMRLVEARCWRRLLPLTLAGLTGALIGAVQVVPTVDASERSIRPLLTSDFALTFSLHPINLLQLWSPYVFADRVFSRLDHPWVHEFAIYSGSIAMVGLPWLWIRRRALRHRTALVATMSAVAVVAIVLALGRYGGLDVLLARLPVLELLRAPTRYIVVAQFALAMLAVIVFQDLSTLGPEGRRLRSRELLLLCLPALASVATTLAWNSGMLPAGGYPLSTLPRAGIGTAFVVVTTALVVLSARRVAWALPALIVVTALDLGSYGVSYVWRTPPQTIASLVGNVPPPPEDPGARAAFVEDQVVDGDILVLAGYRLVSGYVGLYPATTIPFDAPTAVALAGARWLFSKTDWRSPMPGVDRARLLAEAKASHDVARDLDTVDLYKTALVPRGLVLTGPPGIARVLEDRPGHLVVETSAPGRQLLSIAERYHRGWSATANGQPLRVLPVHGDFLGCIVEGGTHRVELRFMPSSFVQGAWLTGAGLLLLPTGVMLAWKQDGA